jgi:hypothetical protein
MENRYMHANKIKEEKSIIIAIKSQQIGSIIRATVMKHRASSELTQQ